MKKRLSAKERAYFALRRERKLMKPETFANFEPHKYVFVN